MYFQNSIIIKTKQNNAEDVAFEKTIFQNFSALIKHPHVVHFKPVR